SIEHVENVSVDLDTSEAIITMNQHISTDVFQKALSSKYSISEKKEKNVFQSTSIPVKEEKNEWKQLFPLFLIFAYIITASILMNINPWDDTNFMLDFMGL